VYNNNNDTGHNTHWSGPQFQQKLHKGDQIREDDFASMFQLLGNSEVVKVKIIALNMAL